MGLWSNILIGKITTRSHYIGLFHSLKCLAKTSNMYEAERNLAFSYQAGTLTPKLPLDQTLHRASQTFPTMDLLEQIESVVC